jgi:hypothetical protein
VPSVSERQRRFFFATKGPAWTKAHHFDVLDTARKKARKRHVRKK